MSDTFTRDPEPLVQYSGDGSRTIFPFPFPVLASDDLLVFVNQNAATGFSITGIGDPNGGEIAFVTPPAPGTTITLLRRTEGIRESAFVDGGPFRASAINAELDRIMLLIQEDREEHGRALRGHPAESGIDFSLPPATERANKVLGFDSGGNPAVFGTTALPTSGDASGALVTPNGATTARVARRAPRGPRQRARLRRAGRWHHRRQRRFCGGHHRGAKSGRPGLRAGQRNAVCAR